MTNYNYLEEMTKDVIEAIKYNKPELDKYELDYNREKLEQELYDDLWTADSVTGNASGSYTFNSAQAREYVIDNMELAKEALEEFCVDAEEIGERFLNEDWEYLDVTIRCYLLGQAISAALDEISEELETIEE